MKTFGWTLEHCRGGITSAEGWVFYAWAKESEATMFGRLWKRTCKGYIAQEAERLLKKAGIEA